MRRRFSIFAVALALLLCTTIVLAQAPTAPPKPGPEVRKMAAFVGSWTSEVEMKPVPNMMPGGKGTSTSTCVWAVGGFAVSCRESGDMGAMGKANSVSFLAWDAEAKNYVYSSVSSMGEVIVSRGVVNGDTWVFDNDSPMQGKMTHGRFTIKYTSKDSAEFKFEMGPNANSMDSIMVGKEMRVMKSAAPAPPKPVTK